MSNYNWCHGPNCHTNHTVDRIRGSKGNKVLRTKKIKVQDLSRWHYSQGWENHFCKLGCLMDYIKEHINLVIAIAPRRECLETPIKDPKRMTTTHTYGINDQYSYNRTETKIEKKAVDNA